MRRTRLVAAMLCVAALLSGLAAASRAQPTAGGAADLVLGAIGLLGTPYRLGGDQPGSGFDCSGLVRYVARSVLGLELPRQAEAISRAGVDVDPLRLLPGDLVFFNTLGRPYSHVGIYVGDGQFVHAPAQRGQVRIAQMSQPYWRTRFDGARRLPVLREEREAVVSADTESWGWLPGADAPYGAVKP